MRPFLVLAALLLLLLRATCTARADKPEQPEPVKSAVEYLPMGQALQFAAPNTLEGLDRDLAGAYQALLAAPKSAYSLLNQNLVSPFASLQQAASQRYQASAEEALRALEWWWRNPEQVCRQMAQQAQQGYQGAQAKLAQSFGGDQEGSLLSRFRPFGRK